MALAFVCSGEEHVDEAGDCLLRHNIVGLMVSPVFPGLFPPIRPPPLVCFRADCLTGSQYFHLAASCLLGTEPDRHGCLHLAG